MGRGNRGTGRQPQWEHPRPGPGRDILRLVHRVTAALLHRCLPQGKRQHDGRGQLLACRRSQRRRAPGHEVIDDQIEGAAALGRIVDKRR